MNLSLLPRALLVICSAAFAVTACQSGGGDDDEDDGPPTAEVPITSSDAGPGMCKGTATACPLLSDEQLCSQSSCVWGASCTGAVIQCATFTTSAACTGARGCSWALNRCQGVSSPCTAWASKAECSAHTGCSWQTGCSGTARQCSSASSVACELTSGCDWVTF